MKKLLLPLFIALLFGQNVFAQDLGTTLTNVGPEYAKSYLAPFTTGSVLTLIRVGSAVLTHRDIQNFLSFRIFM